MNLITFWRDIEGDPVTIGSLLIACDHSSTQPNSVIYHSRAGRPGAKTIKKSRAWIGAQLTICSQKLRNFVCSSTLSLRFVWS